MLYARYLSETQNKHIYETPDGFVTYGFNCLPGVEFPHLLIEDIYVVPECRQKRTATEMADHVCALAKKKGVGVCFGLVLSKSQTPDRSLRVLQGYGMRIYNIQDGALIMAKEIS